MPITPDILETYRRPRHVLRRKLAAGAREDRALAVVMGAGALIFVAQWPALSRAAYLEPAIPLEARLSGALLATVFLLPLLAYVVAAGSHLLAKALGGKGTFHAARLALFWAMLAISPLMLLQGLVAGFVGPGRATLALGVIVLAAFVTIWAILLHEAER